jgi:N-acetylglucosaminyldiphosphoundecaprenol N-acetyl-beta-D-mannosaminyltransferase
MLQPPPPSVPVRTVVLGGLPIAVTDRAEAAAMMVDLALARRGAHEPPLYITSANGQVLSLCANDPEMRALFVAADVIHADGMPLVFASRLKCREPLPERVATSDLVHDIAKVAVARGASFYLLGGTDEVVAKTKANLEAAHTGLIIAGARSGYMSSAEEAAVAQEIAAAQPDILFVSMGVPHEQVFILRHRERLRGVGVAKTSGGLFDFLSGTKKRAPLWMQDAGLEWLYRVGREPRRLLARYALTNPHAAYLLLTRSR